MSEQPYDCIVLGVGGIGSHALRFAAKQGWRVLGLEQFGPAHDRGSSHGQSRIIRRAYFEHPNYVPLTARAFEMWDELNKRHRTSIEIKELMTTTGILQVGLPESEVIQGLARSANEHDLKLDEFSAEEIEQRIPLFKIPGNFVGLFEPDSGFLRVELCVAAAIKQAIREGAELKSNVKVLSWESSDGGLITVETDKGKFQTERLIVSAGAWSSQIMNSLDVPLTIVEKQQHWFQLDRVEQKIECNFPAFLIETENNGCFYGMPEFDILGMKVCEHSRGRELDSPASIDRELNQEVLGRTEAFMNEFMEFGRSRMVHFSKCMYTMSPDGHFVVDHHPSHANVVFAAGMSGHGFKFAPVIGKRLVDMLEGKSDSLFDFLVVSRFQDAG